MNTAGAASEAVFGDLSGLPPFVQVTEVEYRLTLSRQVVHAGKVSIEVVNFGTDSHDPLQLRFMEYSLAAAARARVDSDRMLNFMSAQELRSWVTSLRR